MMTVGLWFTAWTPYLTIAWAGILTDGARLTPLATIWGSVFAKASACYNPLIYAISHPKYRAALFKKFPSLACTAEPEYAGDNRSEMSSTTAISDATSEKQEKTSEA